MLQEGWWKDVCSRTFDGGSFGTRTFGGRTFGERTFGERTSGERTLGKKAFCKRGVGVSDRGFGGKTLCFVYCCCTQRTYNLHLPVSTVSISQHCHK